MNREEVLMVMTVLRGAYPQFYRGITAKEAEATVSLWEDMFRNDNLQIVLCAVKSVIEGDDKGFPPTIGQVKTKMRLLVGSDELTEAEAWNLVSKAVKNGLYGAVEEFEKLPPAVKRIVGSPSQLRDWASMDSDTLHSVVASNFQRSYKVVATREKEIAALPDDVKKLIHGRAGHARTYTLGETVQDLLASGGQRTENPPALAVGSVNNFAMNKEPEALPPAYESHEDTLKRLEESRQKEWEAREAQQPKKRTREEVIAALRGE